MDNHSKVRPLLKQGGSPQSSFPRVEYLLQLLGPETLLLAWPVGSKGTKKKWGHLTRESMYDPGYLRQLESGNIGVALGEKSIGLNSLDLDGDRWAETFLAVNPLLRESLRTRGARGCNVWVRCTGDYPRARFIKTAAGEDVGEWRSNGNQTIISGKHPSGCDYRVLVERPPVRIAFEDIVWPAGWVVPGRKQAELAAVCLTDETDVTDATDETHETKEPEIPGGVCAVAFTCKQQQITSVADLVRISVPKTTRSNHKLLFQLARGIIRFEQERRIKFTRRELIDAFNEWHSASRKFLRSETSKEEYLLEFLNGYGRARCPLGSQALEVALERARTEPLPQAARDFDQPSMQLLIAWCWQLQKAAGAEPFFLSCRDAGLILKISHVAASQWLGGLVGARILQEVEKGSQQTSKASRYRYVDLEKG